jgi:hypothetical protein
MLLFILFHHMFCITALFSNDTLILSDMFFNYFFLCSSQDRSTPTKEPTMCHVNSSPATEDVGHNNDGYQHAFSHNKSTPPREDNTKVRRAPPCSRKEGIVVSLFILASALPVLVFFYVYVVPVLQPPPNLYIRLVGVDGLDPQRSPPEPLAFHLAVDADEASPGQGNKACGGGGNSMLRVSYRGMILVWGRVP